MSEDETDQPKWDPNKIRLAIAKDLRAIELLYQGVWAEVLAKAGNPDMPGGDAMVMRGPVADPEAWSYRDLSVAIGRLEENHGEYEDDRDPQPPLLMLATWSDAIRKERGQDTGLSASIDRECAYIGNSVDWMLSNDEDGNMNFIAIDDLADDLHTVRNRLESLLHIGRKDADNRGAPCLTHGRRYVKVWDQLAEGETVDPDTDLGYRWKCKGDDEGEGAHWADPEDYARANRDQARGLASRLTSSDMRIEYRIEPSTLRTWAERGCVPKRGKDKSGRILYDVPAAIENRDGEHEHRPSLKGIMCGRTRPKHEVLQELFGT